MKNLIINKNKRTTFGVHGHVIPAEKQRRRANSSCKHRQTHQNHSGGKEERNEWNGVIVF